MIEEYLFRLHRSKTGKANLPLKILLYIFFKSMNIQDLDF